MACSSALVVRGEALGSLHPSASLPVAAPLLCKPSCSFCFSSCLIFFSKSTLSQANFLHVATQDVESIYVINIYLKIGLNLYQFYVFVPFFFFQSNLLFQNSDHINLFCLLICSQSSSVLSSSERNSRRHDTVLT